MKEQTNRDMVSPTDLALKKHLEDARSIAIDVCNHTYFPSKEYDSVLFLKESLDRLVVYCEKIILKNN